MLERAVANGCAQAGRVAADNPSVLYAIAALVLLLAFVVRDMLKRY
jgi:hypothetical protein